MLFWLLLVIGRFRECTAVCLRADERRCHTWRRPVVRMEDNLRTEAPLPQICESAMQGAKSLWKAEAKEASHWESQAGSRWLRWGQALSATEVRGAKKFESNRARFQQHTLSGV